jgi:hypothetical protein
MTFSGINKLAFNTLGLMILFAASLVPFPEVGHAATGRMLSQGEIKEFRAEYMVLFNELVGGLLQDEMFYTAGFGAGYPKGHAWAAKVKAMEARYPGADIIRQTYNPLSGSALLPGELWQVAHEIMQHRRITPDTDKWLDEAEFNLRMGDAQSLAAKLPGLDKYSPHMLREKIKRPAPCPEAGLPNTEVMWAMFQLPANDSNIPDEYQAKGRVLRVGVTADGGSIVFLDKASQSVFLDRVATDENATEIIRLR